MAMKYRIVRNGNGKFFLQSKEGFFSLWEKVGTNMFDYPDVEEKGRESIHYKDYTNGQFPTLELARTKFEKLLQIKLNKLRENELTVMDESNI